MGGAKVRAARGDGHNRGSLDTGTPDRGRCGSGRCQGAIFQVRDFHGDIGSDMGDHLHVDWVGDWGSLGRVQRVDRGAYQQSVDRIGVGGWAGVDRDVVDLSKEGLAVRTAGLNRHRPSESEAIGDRRRRGQWRRSGLRHHLPRDCQAEPLEELVLVFNIVNFHKGLDGDAERLRKTKEGIAFLNYVGLWVDPTSLSLG